MKEEAQYCDMCVIKRLNLPEGREPEEKAQPNKTKTVQVMLCILNNNRTELE